MRFRITSITDPDVGERVSAATTRLEDWLNASVGDGQFGSHLEQVTFFVVSTWDDEKENERWALERDRLGHTQLSVGVAIAPAQFRVGDREEWLKVTASALSRKLSARPTRLPKGFEYERFAVAVSTALAAYGTV